MRKIKKKSTPPAVLLTNNLANVINTADIDHKKKIHQYIYGHNDVREALKSLYKNKCAYCETYEDQPEIEHYRPMKEVTGIVHNGYYWLCYEWSNLLFSCHDCNKPLYKGNKFPANGTRQTLATMLPGGGINLAENRLTSNSLSIVEIQILLNPEFPGYDPFDYFIFDNNGEMKPKHPVNSVKYVRAMETIRIIGLNRNKLYLIKRKYYIKTIMRRVKLILYRYFVKGQIANYENEFKDILIDLKKKKQLTPKSEYWFFWNYFSDNFKIYLSYYFKPRLAKGLHATYDYLITQI